VIVLQQSVNFWNCAQKTPFVRLKSRHTVVPDTNTVQTRVNIIISQHTVIFDQIAPKIPVYNSKIPT